MGIGLNNPSTLRDIKYLVNSLDDLWDVVFTVNQMMANKADLDSNRYAVSTIPVNESCSSFILSLSVPEIILGG